jgi:hypothetical protein
MSRPYFVLGTPRSRTAWLAEFLSTEDRPCAHEPSRRLRGRAAFLDWLMQPGMAASDSVLTLRWRDILAAQPAARILLVRRPVRDVVASFVRAGYWAPALERLVQRIDDEIAAILQSGHKVMFVPFDRLEREDVCAAAYLWCNGAAVPAGRWLTMKDCKVLASIPDAIRDTAHDPVRLLDIYPELGALG